MNAADYLVDGFFGGERRSFADTTPVTLPDLYASDLQLGFDYNGTICIFRICADGIGDLGIVEADT